MYSEETIKLVEDLNYNVTSSIIEQQYCTIPHIIRDLSVVRQNKYRYDGTFYKAPDPDNMVILNVSPFPFTSNVNNHPLFIETMPVALSKGYIRPFCLFLNGKFIKWTNITVIKDYTYSYIIVNKFTEAITSSNIIELPCSVQYSENKVSIAFSSSTDIELCFDTNGKFTVDPSKVSTRIKFKSENILFDMPAITPLKLTDDERLFTSGEGLTWLNGINNGNYNIIVADGFKDINTSSYNVIHFKDGLLDTSVTSDKSFDDSLGMGVFIFNKKLSGDNKFLVFGNMIVNKSLQFSSYITHKEKLIDYLLSANAFKYKLAYTICYNNKIKTTFDRNKTFDNNVSDMITEISNHNFNILNEVYKERSLIEVVELTGAEVKKSVTGMIMKVARKMYRGLECGIMIFKNNRLFENFHTMITDKNNHAFIAGDIKDDDKFEILFFKYIKNNSSTLCVNQNIPVKTSSYYDLENCSLFSIDLETSKYPIHNKDLIDISTIKYEVPFTCTKLKDDHTYNVTLTDPYYYGRTLYVSHSRQFRYCYYNINSDCLGVTLSPDFRFCHNINKYMVFINGKLIPKNNITLTIMDKDQPFDELALYTNITMHAGDMIEIFYLPMEINNIVPTPNEIPETGIIEIPTAKLDYCLSKELYLFFVNGSKIHKCDLVDLDREKVKLTTNLDTRTDVQIISHIVKDDELYKLFKTNATDSFVSLIDSLSIAQINDLFVGGDVKLTNNQARVASEAIDMEKLRYEIYKNFFGEFGTNEIEYTFNEEENLTTKYDVDKAGNFIINSSDASNEDKADLDRSDTNNGEVGKYYGK